MSVVNSKVIEANANPFGPRMQTSHVTVQKVRVISPTPMTTPRTNAQILRCALSPPGRTKSRRRNELIKPNQDIAADAGREVDLGLEVEFNSHRKCSVLEVPVVVDGAFEEVA